MKRILFFIVIIVLIALGIGFIFKPEAEIPDIESITDIPQTEEQATVGAKALKKAKIPLQNVRSGYRALTFEIPIKQLPSNFQVEDVLNIYGTSNRLLVNDARVLNLKLEDKTDTALVAIEISKNDMRNFMLSAINGPVTFVEGNRAYSFVYTLAQENLSSAVK